MQPQNPRSTCLKVSAVTHAAELRALLLGLSISNEKGDDLEEDLKYWMKEFDQDEDNVIGFDEFCNVLKK